MRGIQLQSPSPPIGLAYIGAYLKQHGYAYKAIDACGLGLERVATYKRLPDVFIQGISVEDIVSRVDPNSSIIGFSCNYSHCWPLVEEIAVSVRRKFPSALLVAGGEHCTSSPETCFDEDLFDVVVLGEGEETFLELIRCVEEQNEWQGIDGISYKALNGAVAFNKMRKRIANIDSLPIPDWDNWCIENYISNNQVSGINLGRSMPILGSRGCPFQCKFCSNSEMWTQRYIMRDPKLIVDEMELMKERYQINGFTFMDSTFIVNKQEVKKFAKELSDRGLNISYQIPAGTRSEAFDEELSFLLEASGLKNFAFAPESGSDLILKAIGKKLDLTAFEQAVRAILKTNMSIGCFIVIGFPEETNKTLSETIHFLRKLALMGVHDVTVSKFTPYPGSEYFIELEKKGLVNKMSRNLQRVINFYAEDGKSYSDSVNAHQLQKWMYWMYINFYIISFVRRPWRVARNVWDLLLKGKENTRYMRLLSEIFYNRRRWQRKVKQN